MSNQPIHDPPLHSEYSIEFVVQATGLSSETILSYQEQGLVRSDQGVYDDEALHTLRQIEHLQRAYEVNLSGLKMILNLMSELDHLRSVMRARR